MKNKKTRSQLTQGGWGDHKIIILKEERESMIITNKGGWGYLDDVHKNQIDQKIKERKKN